MLKKKYFKTKDECEVTFEFDSGEAKKVAVVSEANGWQPVKMSKRKKDGIFYAKVRLPKDSQYQYRYLVNDQTWVVDQNSDGFVPNEFGEQNSIVSTTPSAN